MPVLDQGGGGGWLRGHMPPPHEEDMSDDFFSRIICTVMVWWSLRCFGLFLDGLGCFNGPHDGYCNRSNSQTSLPRPIVSPTDSWTVLPRAVG